MDSREGTLKLGEVATEHGGFDSLLPAPKQHAASVAEIWRASAMDSQDKVLSIYKGDDTGGMLGKRLVLNIQSPFDLTGCVIVFNFQNITRRFENVAAGDSLEVFFSHNETARMSLGTGKATVIAIDAAGKIRTVTDSIRIKVTNNLKECYGDATVTVTIGTAVNWDNICNKPFDGKLVDLSTDSKVVKALGDIIEALGGSVYVD